MSKITNITSTAMDSGQRLDRFLAEHLRDLTRNAIQILIANGNVSCNGNLLKKNYKIKGDEILTVTVPEPQETDIIPENIPIDIVYEDDDLLVVNKARGMVVHPAVGNWSGTLVNALMYHCGDRLSGVNGEIRPGIVHRIDKDTSGLLVIAKNDFSHVGLAEQIARHDVRRQYEAIVCGNVRDDAGTINQPIGRHKIDRKKMAVVADGRPAITHYQVIARFAGYTHMEFTLETGRTHQIRVHMAYTGHPIIGDPLYGNQKDRFTAINGQCLHAKQLEFVHPRTNKLMRFTAKRPEYFSEILKKLGKHY